MSIEKETIMHRLVRNMLRQAIKAGRMLLGISLLVCPLAYAAAQAPETGAPSSIPMTPQHWTIVQPDDEIIYYRETPDVTYVHREGVPQGLLVVKKGAATVKDVDFSNGTIEYDMRPIGEGDAAVMQDSKRDRAGPCQTDWRGVRDKAAISP